MADPDRATDLPALIDDAQALVRDYARASKTQASELAQRAELAIKTFDEKHPRLSLMQQCFALVRAAADKSADTDAIKARAQALERQLDEFATPGKRRNGHAQSSSRAVDAWTLDMFRATESAIPRETLISDFVDRYRRERHLSDNDRHDGPWLFIFETVSEAQHITGLRAHSGHGLHPLAFEQHCRRHLPDWRADLFLSLVIDEQRDLDGWYALPPGGSPLFDALLDVPRRLHGEADYWINGVCLPGDGRHETLAVYTLYRNVGNPFQPEPPSGMRQDMRLLTVLGLAWRQLEHQVKGLARLAETDRRDMINLIAPGLLHHEIGFNMRTAYGQAYEQFHLLKRIAANPQPADVELAARYAYGIAHLVHDLYRVTDAFNNLDKRGQTETTTLDKVLGDLKLLLHHRLGAAHTELDWDSAAFAVETLHTDVVLLGQSLMNLVNNAVNALIEDDTPPPRCIRVTRLAEGGGRLVLAVQNNGPAIPGDLARDIFKRGYTTRKDGHGQGLYLARLVAHYLGGDLALMAAHELPEGFNVGFRFSVAREFTAQEGIARVQE